MDYEKKYKEALERARLSRLQLLDIGEEATEIEYIFPELVESEDEKIRKALMKFIEKFPYERLENDGVSIKEALAWLEKQGTPNQTSIWKHWKDGIAGNGEGKPIYLIKNGYTYSLSSCLCFECDYIELSELDKLMLEKGEQKPVEWSEEDEERL